jgi:hypothetical protein
MVAWLSFEHVRTVFNQFNQFIFGSIDESPASTYRDGHKDVPQALA